MNNLTINQIKSTNDNIIKSNYALANPQNNATTEGLVSTFISQAQFGNQYERQRLQNDLYIRDKI
jgi:hypothetical protein